MVRKFVDKKKATTYNLVYRSQEDPLAFEEGSNDRVFVEATQKGGLKASSSKRADQTVEQSLRDLQLDDADDAGAGRRAGEAALYGIYLDDRSYDYTKHLRPVGAGGGVILEVPDAAKKKRDAVEIRGAELPAEVLPSQHRMDIRSEAFPRGLQPYMDAEVREALEALDDDGGTDEFDDTLLEKLDADELSSADEGPGGFGSGSDDSDFDPEDVFAQVRRMKARREQRADSDDEASVGGSTGFSMSSSAMYRNDKLTLLDEQYERVEAMYGDSDSDESEARYDSDGHYIPQLDADGKALPASTRPDFEHVLDEFLADYELTGKKMQTVVEGGSGAGKLGTYRNALLDVGSDGSRELSKQQVLLAGQRLDAESNAKSDATDEAELDALFVEKARTPWDCESILSTYSSLENHPATIYEERTPRIRLSRKSGLPLAASPVRSSSPDDAEPRERAATARPANETREEKRTRKRQVQEAKRARRDQKKETRGVYAEQQERRQQSRRDRQQLVVHIA
ncbi:Protein ltv1 [Coemansia biformis]|uniref:Protein ltv1 n=1 Tax=Coemansia biformis TaxID=1286918 RepID=A0A9W7YHK8_9FUNG|nr:Protein ltv1 [Coemansia biformis]